MLGHIPRALRGGAVAVPVLLAIAGAPPSEKAPDSGEPAKAWLVGRADEALRLLAEPPVGGSGARQRDLNRAVLLLYLGRLRESESLLGEVRARNPSWSPVLRWLARAQCQQGREEAAGTTAALLASSQATGRDHLWAAQVFAERGDHARARESFARAVGAEDDLYLGWLGLGDAEAALGNMAAAQRAWGKARSLYGGGDELYRLGRAAWDGGRTAEARRLFEDTLLSLEGPAYEERVLSLLPELYPPSRRSVSAFCRILVPGERLRYQARYLFRIRIGTLVLEDREQDWVGEKWTHRVRFGVKAKFGWFRINSSYESLVAEEGTSMGQAGVSDDSTSVGKATTYEMDPERRICLARSVSEGLFSYDQLLLPPGVQDGVSLIALARSCSRTGQSVAVLAAADGTWKGTRIRVVGRERLNWRDTEVAAVRVDITSTQKGPGGLSGTTSLWLSDDEQAVPYRARMKVKLGSVSMELEPSSR